MVIELKNPRDERATIQSGFKQLQTYKEFIPSLFTYNSVLVVSDGLEANGFPYSKIHFSNQTRLGVINSQVKPHSNEHKMGVIEQKDQKKLRNSETQKKPGKQGWEYLSIS